MQCGTNLENCFTKPRVIALFAIRCQRGPTAIHSSDPIAVPIPQNEMSRYWLKESNHFRGLNVTTMNDEVNTVLTERRYCPFDNSFLIVRIADNANPHG